MKRLRGSLAGALAVIALAASTRIAATQRASPPDGGSASVGAPRPSSARDTSRARINAGVAKLYDTSVLHHIDVRIAAADVNQIVERTTERLRCTFTIDGLTLTNVGVRQSGGVYHPYVPIAAKPSLSIKFDEFTKAQRLYGLDKLVLKNELQDLTLVNEHLSYEIFRRAGIAAPLTAHARVTINGIDDGIYLMREPIDKDFLIRNFGSGFEGGDLYEIENTREFVFDPSYPALDDEGKNGRTRARLVDFATAIRSATPSSFVTDVSSYVDLEELATFVAAEIATRHWDGLTFRNNNTYVYAHPKDGRFVFLPYGADQAFIPNRWLDAQPRSYLVQQMIAVPSLLSRVNDAVDRITREPIWNQQVLEDRLDRVERILSTAETGGRTGSDVARFFNGRAQVERVIRSGAAAR